MRKLLFAIALSIGGLVLPDSAAAAVKSCAGAEISDATIEQVQANLARYAGRCVRMRGILADGRLYADRQATLETRDKTADDRRPKRSIVVLRDGQFPPALVELVGRLSDCGWAHDAVASYQAAHPDEIVMVSGFCHTSIEAYFDKPMVRILSTAPILRLLEAEVPLAKRLLVETPAVLPGRGKAIDAAKALLVAISTRDEAAFRRLHNPLAQDILDTDGPSGRTNEWVAEAHTDFLRSGTLRPVAAAILAHPERQTRVFIEADDAADFRDNGGTPYRLTTCWCTVDNCSGRWPIALYQADNIPARPYFCAMVGSYLLGPRKPTVPYVELPEEKAGFAEPPR